MDTDNLRQLLTADEWASARESLAAGVPLRLFGSSLYPDTTSAIIWGVGPSWRAVVAAPSLAPADLDTAILWALEVAGFAGDDGPRLGA